MLALHQRFQEIGGTLTTDGVTVPLSKATVSGDRLRVSAPDPRGRIRTYEGVARGHLIEGRSGVRLKNQPWRASRDPSTEANIETPAF